MQFKIFTIPASGAPQTEEELNRFLRSHRVVSVQKSLESLSQTLCWCFCVEYVEGPQPVATQKQGRKPPVDYKEVLSGPDFAIYVRLRERRKELAEMEGAAVFTVCTNEQLAEIAKQRPKTITDLRKISGIGEARAEKFGEAFLEIIADSETDHAADRKSD